MMSTSSEETRGEGGGRPPGKKKGNRHILFTSQEKKRSYNFDRSLAQWPYGRDYRDKKTAAMTKKGKGRSLPSLSKRRLPLRPLQTRPEGKRSFFTLK